MRDGWKRNLIFECILPKNNAFCFLKAGIREPESPGTEFASRSFGYSLVEAMRLDCMLSPSVNL